MYANFPVKLPNGATFLPDGSGFLVAEVNTDAAPREDPIHWNPYNRVVQDHRDGTIDHAATNRERAKRGLTVPWTPLMGATEIIGKPYF